jgi:hypothetical protein
LYSEYRLSVKLDSARKIKKLRTTYRVKVVTSTNLEKGFGEYAEKFYQAANKIASSLLESKNTSVPELDTFVFPTAFLYRHSIELLLKGIAFQTITNKTARVNFAKDTFHNLELILNKIIMLQNNGNRTKAEIDWLQSHFKDISIMDKESDSFRYPFHIKRKSNPISGAQYDIERVFENQTHIDLVKFANKFEAAYEILRLWYEKKSTSTKNWKELEPVFIEKGGSYYGQAVVGYGYKRQDYFPYVSAYVETAGYFRHCMKEAQDNGDTLVKDALFLPMCYLYRNAVELFIKAVWFEVTREDF